MARAFPLDVEGLRKTITKMMEKYPKYTMNDKLAKLSERTGVDKAYILVVAIALMIITLYLIGGASLFTDVFGFLYPAYYSYKAIDMDNSAESKQVRKGWLVYWVVFTVFIVFESISDILLSWIPFYFFFKLFFLVWSYHPRTQGALTVYEGFLRPYLVPLFLDISIVNETPVNAPPALDEFTLTVDLDSIAGSSLAGQLLYVSVSVQHPPERKRTGVEGTRFKSISRRGPGRLDEELRLTPLQDTQGMLLISLNEDTESLGDDVLIGKATIQLSKLRLNVEQSMNLALSDAELSLRLRVTK